MGTIHGLRAGFGARPDTTACTRDARKGLHRANFWCVRAKETTLTQATETLWSALPLKTMGAETRGWELEGGGGALEAS